VHEIWNEDAEPLSQDDEDVMLGFAPHQPLKKRWSFAFEVGWSLEDDRGDDIDREADVDFHPYGGWIESRGSEG
jgi:hypothetical protein